jgi:molecular chaperone GrpE
MSKKDKKEQSELSEKKIKNAPPEKNIDAKVVEQSAADEEESKDSVETVTIPLSEYSAQLEEIDHLNQKTDEFSDGWQRERAEFANYRKRMSRDLDAQKVNNKIDIIKKYLSVKDDLERALKNMPALLIDEPWIGGIQLINQKLSNLLDGEGIQPIPAEGLAFDPEMHEAISHEDDPEVESGFIIEVVQQGYTIGERVVRPSQVRVAK